ncbi:MAG TPA: SRPBCC domain-containing protein [Acidimicrobiales bacterium]
MTSQNFTTTFEVDQTPEQAFAAITNVRGWWSGDIEGRTDTLGEEFTYRYQDIHYTKQRISEFMPGRKVVWQIVDSYLNFTEDPHEWAGTEVIFEVTPKGEGTEIRFDHVGLTPESECYEQCSSAWGFYINGSLRRLITTGHGEPNVKEESVA